MIVNVRYNNPPNPKRKKKEKTFFFRALRILPKVDGEFNLSAAVNISPKVKKSMGIELNEMANTWGGKKSRKKNKLKFEIIMCCEVKI